MSDWFRLFYEFFLTGLLAVGGGMATLPFLYEIGDKTGWYTRTTVIDMIALSEATPGPIGINMASYIGFITFGVLGGLVASIALVLPAVIIILIISKILDKFKTSYIVSGIFHTLRPASTALISAAGIGVAKETLLYLGKEFSISFSSIIGLINYKAIILAVVIFVAIKLLKKVHPIIFIAASAAIGIIFSM